MRGWLSRLLDRLFPRVRPVKREWSPWPKPPAPELEWNQRHASSKVRDLLERQERLPKPPRVPRV